MTLLLIKGRVSKFFFPRYAFERQELKRVSYLRIFIFSMGFQVKCCKGPCPVVDMGDLFACNSCMSKAFDKYYSMYKATWWVHPLWVYFFKCHQTHSNNIYMHQLIVILGMTGKELAWRSLPMLSVVMLTSTGMFSPSNFTSTRYL